MRFRWKLLSLFILLAVATFAAPNVTKGDPRYQQFREVGDQLKCQCESHCSYTVSGCNMTGCSFRAAMTMEINNDLDKGYGGR